MFTIKHQHENGETLYAGKEPSLMSKMGSSDGGTVAYTNENGVVIFITGGVVYVMNEIGKTVAHYDLRPQADNMSPIQR